MRGRGFKAGFSGFNNNNFQLNNQFNNNNNIKKSINFKNKKEKLKFIETIEKNDEPITNIVSLGKAKYLMISQNECFFRKVGKQDDKYKDKLMGNTIIRKAIFSNNIVMCIEEHNDNNGNKSYSLRIIAEVNNQFQSFSCKINNEPYDAIEYSNSIFIVGNNIIEQFNINNGQIKKVAETFLNKNLNNNNNNDIYKVLCIEKTNNSLICGHSLGYISKWIQTQSYPFLKNVEKARIHINSINKILFDIIENTEVIISCSADKTLKVHSFDEFVCFKVLNFEEEVIDVQKVINHNNQTNYFINLSKGSLKLYDSSFRASIFTKFSLITS